MFPDAIDLIVRALRSGLPISEAIIGAGREIADPVGSELRLVESGMRLGRDLEALLWDIAKRIDTPEFRFFIIALSVQRETGGNLAETLANLADALRRRRQMRAKVRAMSSETRATTMILGGLPVVVIGLLMLTSPDYLAPLFTRCPRLFSRRGRGRNARHRRRHHEQDGDISKYDQRAAARFAHRRLAAGRRRPRRRNRRARRVGGADEPFRRCGRCCGPKNAFERRLEQIVERKETLRRQALSARTRRQHRRPVGLMRAAVTRLNLLRSRHAAEARKRLARAGIRSPDAMIGYLFARLSLPSLFGVRRCWRTALCCMCCRSRPISGFCRQWVAALLGFYAPNIYLKNVASKRAKQLQLALPDGLDLMVICAEAGLSLDATLLRVSRELATSWPELAEEFAITAAELTFLPDRRLAFENLNNRTDSEAIRAVVNTLQQTAKFGTPLAQSLRMLAERIRERRA